MRGFLRHQILFGKADFGLGQTRLALAALLVDVGVDCGVIHARRF